MIPNKESSVPCNNCMMPLPRQNYNKYRAKCKKCYRFGCTNCMLDDMCLDCFISVTNELTPYFADKYVEVRA